MCYHPQISECVVRIVAVSWSLINMPTYGVSLATTDWPTGFGELDDTSMTRITANSPRSPDIRQCITVYMNGMVDETAALWQQKVAQGKYVNFAKENWVRFLQESEEKFAKIRKPPPPPSTICSKVKKRSGKWPRKLPKTTFQRADIQKSYPVSNREVGGNTKYCRLL